MLDDVRWVCRIDGRRREAEMLAFVGAILNALSAAFVNHRHADDAARCAITMNGQIDARTNQLQEE